MAWYIQEGVNNGYPAQDTWRESWQTSWTSNGNIRYPDYMWRIEQGINNGYPWLYPWFKKSSTDTGEMVIGGAISNYPNGFTPANRGGIKNDFDDINMNTVSGGNGANSTITSALSGKMFIVGNSVIQTALNSLNDPDIFTDTVANTISKMYGANIFDCFISCKVFPFNLTALTFFNGGSHSSVVSGNTGTVKAFGKWDLATGANLAASSFGYYHFPTITVEPLQAWEIENIDFSLYLPMSGIYPIDIRGYSEIDITLFVDLITGTGEYTVLINNQIVGVHRVLLATDVPMNTNQGRMQANMLTNVISSVGKSVGTLGGALVGGVGGAVIGSAIGSLVGNTTEHYAMSCPAVGGLASMQEYGMARVIAKIPKMFKDGYGYFETLGANRSTAYVRLAECSGFVKCKNYKTDIIVATDTEKTEIERLMNEGVFI